MESLGRIEMRGLARAGRRVAVAVALLFGFGLLAPALAPDATASHNTTVFRVSQNLGTQENQPSIAFGADGQVYAAYARFNGATGARDVVVRSDQDGWAADGIPVFTATRVANDNPGSADESLFSNVPMAVDGNGSLYVGWIDARGVATTGLDIRVARSDDNGNSFVPSARVSDFGAVNFETYPAMAVGPSGTLYMVWQDDRLAIPDIFFSKSSDQGQTWSPNVRINNVSGTNNQVWPRIAVDDQERIFVVWTDTPFANNRVLFDRSADFGATWGTDVEIGNAAGSNFQPDVGVGERDVVHVAWESDRANDAGLYYTRSLDGGATWLPEGRVNDIPAGGVPTARIGFAPGGLVYIVFLTNGPPGELAVQLYGLDGSLEIVRGGVAAGAIRYTVAGDGNGNVFFIWSRDDGGPSLEIYAAWLDNAPVNPTGLQGTVSGSTVALAWDQNPEEDLGGYFLYRSLPNAAAEFVASLPPTATTYADSGLADGHWTYWLYAFDVQGHLGGGASAAVDVGLTTDDRLDALQAQLNALQAQLNALQTALQDAQADITALQNQNTQLQADLLGANTALGGLRDQLSSSQQLNMILLIVVIALTVISILLAARRKGGQSVPASREMDSTPATQSPPPPQ